MNVNVKATTLLQESEHNFGVYLCGLLSKKSKDDTESIISDHGGIDMVIDTLAHGCEGVSISFRIRNDNKGFVFEPDENTLLQVVVNKDTLRNMINLLELAETYYD